MCFDKNTIIASNPEGSSSLSAMNNFQIFMTLLVNTEADNRAARQNNMLSTFTLLFPGYRVQILPNGLFFNNPDTKHSFTLDENNFDALRDVLNEISGMNNSVGGTNSGFNPTSKKAAEIAAKLMKGRARAAASKGEKADGVLARYVSVLTIGLKSLSLQDCLNLTVYQLYDLIERYGLYMSWDLDIRSRLAGGQPDDRPDDWMKDIH